MSLLLEYYFRISSVFKLYGHVIILLIGVSNIISCQSESIKTENEEYIELTEFETIVAVKDTLLATPSLIKFSENSHLFIYDKGIGKIIELTDDNKKKSYGRLGRGPGEFLKVNNIFLTNRNLYVVDYGQFRINKFDLQGDFISQMDYGELGAIGTIKNTPSAPFSPTVIRAADINNEPVVNLEGEVLLPPVSEDSIESVYQLRNWNGDLISNIGNIPDNSSFAINYDQLESDVNEHRIPAYYKTNVFIVNDKSKVGEYFFIYSAFPKILKYNSEGKKIWESDIIHAEAIDSIRNSFYKSMESMMNSSNPKSRINLEYYISGESNTNGDLFLIMDSNPTIIHHFDNKGSIVNKYKVKSNDGDLLPIFTIDSDLERFFLITQTGEIRSYPY